MSNISRDTLDIDKIKLDKILSLIKYDDELGWSISGPFEELNSKFRTQQVLTRSHRNIAINLGFIHQDLWNIETIFLRLAWLKELWDKSKLEEYMWMTFVQSDILLFHIEIKSIFDYVAKIIHYLPFIKVSTPQRFNDLLKWIAKPRNSENFDSEVQICIQSCDWFSNFKDTRDGLVHFGEFPIVFLEKDKILFQIYEGWNKQVNIPEIMYNENVVDFEMYAGLYYGYVLDFLMELSSIIDEKIELQRYGWDPRSSHPGLRIVKQWINRIIE